MSTYAALAHTCWVDGYDLGPDLEQISLPIEVDELVDTRFGMTGQSRRSGLESVAASVTGFLQLGSGLVEETLWTSLSTARQVVTCTPDGAAGSVAYFFQSRSFKFTPFDGKVGDLAPFSLDIKGVRGNGTLSVGAVRGRVLAAKGTVSATGVLGSSYQLGALSASQYLYAALHVFSAGTTITVVLESDADSGFASPTTQATFGPLTTTGGTWATRVVGAITDTYYRLRVTAITGSFSVAGVAGIKPLA